MDRKMNANELADELDNMLKAIGLTDNRVPAMLRQQQAEIADKKLVNDTFADLIKKQGKKIDEQQAEIEALKKELETCKTIVALSNIAWERKHGKD